MKRILLVGAVISATLSSAVFAADVGVSVSIGQPGFYGRIDIGDYPYPQPRLIYSQPRVIQQTHMNQEPVYLHVPPGHAKNWSKYCRQYNACNEKAYFVQDGWYNQEFVPHYQAQHGERGENRYEGNRKPQKNQGGKHQNNGNGNGNGNNRNHK